MAGIVRPAAVGFEMNEAQRASPIEYGVRKGKKSKKSKRKMQEIPDPKTAKERHFYWEISSSLAVMGADGATVVEKRIAPPAAIMYRPEDSAPGSVRVGDVKHAIIYGGRITFVRNNFPVAMVLSSNTMSGRVYASGAGDAGYERGLFICPGNWSRTFDPDDGHFALPHAHLFDPTVQKYSKVAGRNLLDECKPNVENTMLVCFDNPLVDVIKAFRTEIRKMWPNFRLEGAQMGAHPYFVVPSDIVVKANEIFTSCVLAKMPHIDLSETKLRLSRLGGDFTAPVIPSASEAQNNNLLNMHCSFSVNVALSYCLLNEE